MARGVKAKGGLNKAQKAAAKFNKGKSTPALIAASKRMDGTIVRGNKAKGGAGKTAGKGGRGKGGGGAPGSTAHDPH
jgi:hypothetical protein